MNDLRHDPAAQASKAAGLSGTSLEMSTHYADRRAPTWFAASDTATVRVVLAGDTATVPAHVLTPEQLRTVPMPNLRTPEARTLDAARRGLDCRTADDKLVAELVRLVDALQALTLRVEMLEAERGRA